LAPPADAAKYPADLGSETLVDERAALRTVTSAIKHRRYVLIAIIALVTLAAGVASIVRPPTYQGTALLFVDERFNSSQGFDLALQAGELLSAHFIETATSRPVLERACSGKYFDTPATVGYACSPEGLLAGVSANTVRGTSWIAVSMISRSAPESAALANAVARAMIDQNQADIEQLLAPTKNFLEGELNRLQTAIAAEQAQIAQLQKQSNPNVNNGSNSAAIAAHQANLTLLQSQYSATYARIQDLVIEQNRLAGSLTEVQTATVPSKPIDPDPLRYLLAGLLAGLCLGLATVLIIDRLDDRIFDTEALARAAGTSLVVEVGPRAPRTESGRTFEPYALARASLVAQHPALTKLLVVAASSRDRVRRIAAALGMAGVKAGQTVLVVDAEAHNYVMHQQSGRNGSKMTIVSTPSNGDTRIPIDAIADPEGKYDLTIMSAPSPDVDPTAVSLARMADVAIIVATAAKTRFSEARRTADSLRMAGVEVVAGILASETLPDEEPEVEEPDKVLYQMAATPGSPGRLPTWRGPGRT